MKINNAKHSAKLHTLQSWAWVSQDEQFRSLILQSFQKLAETMELSKNIFCVSWSVLFCWASPSIWGEILPKFDTCNLRWGWNYQLHVGFQIFCGAQSVWMTAWDGMGIDLLTLVLIGVFSWGAMLDMRFWKHWWESPEEEPIGMLAFNLAQRQRSYWGYDCKLLVISIMASACGATGFGEQLLMAVRRWKINPVPWHHLFWLSA